MPFHPSSQEKARLEALLETPGAAEVLVGAVAMLAYIGTVAFGFVHDEKVLILQNPGIRHWGNILRYFHQDMWAGLGRGTASYYRPVFMLWLRLNDWLFGLRPAGWHACTVVLHAIAAVLVFRLAARLTQSRAAACAAGILFALHPAHLESVAWVSGATDSLCTIFVCGTVLRYLQFCRDGKLRSLAASVGLACLSLLSKETAVMLPLLLAASVAADVGGWKRLAQRKSLLIFVVLDLVYLSVRAAALHGAHPFAHIGVGQMILTWPVVFAFYLRELLVPWPMSLYHDVFAVHTAAEPAFVGALLLTSAVVGLLWWWARSSSRRPLIIAATAWFLLPLAPVFNLRIFPPGQLVADRYLYLPSVGFSLLLTLAACDLLQHAPGGRERTWASAGVLATSLIYAVIVFSSQTAWASDILLYKQSVAVASRNPIAACNLGVAYVDRGDLDDGIHWLEHSAQLDGENSDTQFALAQAYYYKGNFPAAYQCIRQGLQRDPRRADGWLLASEIALDSGNQEGALAAAQHAQQLWPEGPGYQSMLGFVEWRRGDRIAAETAFRRELSLYPDDRQAQMALESLQAGKEAPNAGLRR